MKFHAHHFIVIGQIFFVRIWDFSFNYYAEVSGLFIVCSNKIPDRFAISVQPIKINAVFLPGASFQKEII